MSLMNAVIRKYDPIMKQAIGSMQNDTENAAADTINIGIKYANGVFQSNGNLKRESFDFDIIRFESIK